MPECVSVDRVREELVVSEAAPSIVTSAEPDGPLVQRRGPARFRLPPHPAPPGIASGDRSTQVTAGSAPQRALPRVGKEH